MTAGLAGGSLWHYKRLISAILADNSSVSCGRLAVMVKYLNEPLSKLEGLVAICKRKRFSTYWFAFVLYGVFFALLFLRIRAGRILYNFFSWTPFLFWQAYTYTSFFASKAHCRGTRCRLRGYPVRCRFGISVIMWTLGCSILLVPLSCLAFWRLSFCRRFSSFLLWLDGLIISPCPKNNSPISSHQDSDGIN